MRSRRKAYLVCFALVLFSLGCSKRGEEGVWHQVQIEEIGYSFMISSSSYTLPVETEGFDMLVVGVNWDIINASGENAIFSWELIYFIDENGMVYHPFTGRIDRGSSFLTPGSTCYGSASMEVPETTDLFNLKCGIVGDRMNVLVKLKPRDKTDELKRRLGIL